VDPSPFALDLARAAKPLARFAAPPKHRKLGALLLEQDDEWAVVDRRYFSAESMRQLLQPITGELQQDLIAAVA